MLILFDIIQIIASGTAKNVEKKIFMRQKRRKKNSGYLLNGDIKKRIKHFVLGFYRLEVCLVSSLGD